MPPTVRCRAVLSLSVVCDSLRLRGPWPTRLLCPWNGWRCSGGGPASAGRSPVTGLAAQVQQFPLYLLLTTSLFTYVESETLLQSKVKKYLGQALGGTKHSNELNTVSSIMGLRSKRGDTHETNTLFIIIRQRAPRREWPNADPKRVQIFISNIYAQTCRP